MSAVHTQVRRSESGERASLPVGRQRSTGSGSESGCRGFASRRPSVRRASERRNRKEEEEEERRLREEKRERERLSVCVCMRERVSPGSVSAPAAAFSLALVRHPNVQARI